MELWLDSIDLDFIRAAKDSASIKGITTNPSILSQNELPLEKMLNKLLLAQPGAVAIQVTANTTEGMIEQAERLAAINGRIIIKVPVTKAGVSVMRYLAEHAIPTMATAIYEPAQILLSILAGATYAAPYVGKLNEMGVDYKQILNEMQELIYAQGSSTKIIAAALRDKQQIIDCMRLGVAAITVSKPVFANLIEDNAQTVASLRAFEADWQAKKFASEIL